MTGHFSRRRAQIEARYAQLVRGYRQAHGRDPSPSACCAPSCGGWTRNSTATRRHGTGRRAAAPGGRVRLRRPAAASRDRPRRSRENHRHPRPRPRTQRPPAPGPARKRHRRRPGTTETGDGVSGYCRSQRRREGVPEPGVPRRAASRASPPESRQSCFTVPRKYQIIYAWFLAQHGDCILPPVSRTLRPLRATISAKHQSRDRAAAKVA
jgi:hypothetical protein